MKDALSRCSSFPEITFSFFFPFALNFGAYYKQNWKVVKKKKYINIFEIRQNLLLIIKKRELHVWCVLINFRELYIIANRYFGKYFCFIWKYNLLKKLSWKKKVREITFLCKVRSFYGLDVQWERIFRNFRCVVSRG